MIARRYPWQYTCPPPCKTSQFNRACIASDEIYHNKSLWVHRQHACILLSPVLRFSSCGDMSYSVLSKSTLWEFITLAYKYEWKNIWMEGENWGEKGKAGKLIQFGLGLDGSISVKDRDAIVVKKLKHPQFDEADTYYQMIDTKMKTNQWYYLTRWKITDWLWVTKWWNFKQHQTPIFLNYIDRWTLGFFPKQMSLNVFL